LSELTKRILFAVPAATLFVWLAWMGGAYFFSIMALLAVGTIWEIDRLMKNAGFPGYLFLSLLLASLMWALRFLPVWMVVAELWQRFCRLQRYCFRKRENLEKNGQVLFSVHFTPHLVTWRLFMLEIWV